MKPKLLLTLAAIVLAAVGLYTLISPAAAWALDAGASDLSKAAVRNAASVFIGLAVVNWFARNADASKARDALFLGNTVGFGLWAVLFGLAMFAGTPAFGWVFVLIYLLFTVAFFVVGRANMSTGAS